VPRAPSATARRSLDTILLSVPTTSPPSSSSRGPAISRRAARAAVDPIHAEEFAELTLADIVDQVGVGMRALDKGLRDELQCTPESFVQNVRMDRARRELHAPSPGGCVTVSGVAARWGFTHAGRLAKAYRRRYALSPSNALALARRRNQ
jgi:AraC-like DNA-binding protein